MEVNRLACELSVVVRFVVGQNEEFLNAAISSLRMQNGQSVWVILVLSRYEKDEILFNRIRKSVDELIVIDKSSFDEDTRSKSLNRGIAAVTTRYMAFLDYDDTLLTEAAQIMVEGARASGAGVTVFGVDRCVRNGPKIVNRQPYNMVMRNKVDLCMDNFIPLHAYIVDRSQLTQQVSIPEYLTRLEDYYLILQLIRQVEFDFSNMLKSIGLYNIRLDGSNTVSVSGGTVADGGWSKAREVISTLKTEIRFEASVAEIEAAANRYQADKAKTKLMKKLIAKSFARSPRLLRFLVNVIKYRQFTA